MTRSVDAMAGAVVMRQYSLFQMQQISIKTFKSFYKKH